MDGWVKFHRKLISSDLWLSEEFTRGQAWLDLVALAQYKKGFIRVRGIRIELERGEVGYSLLQLSKRWHWSRSKTRRFINELKMDQQIDIKTDINVCTVITILNYDFYNDIEQQKGQQTIQQTDSKQDNSIYIKKEKNVYTEPKTSKNSLTPCTEQEITEIATALQVSVDSVRNIHQTILDTIADGTFQSKRYGQTVYYTLRKWVNMRIADGKLKKVGSSLPPGYKPYKGGKS